MSTLTNVLSLNVRLSEGGAAKVMLSIHEYLISNNVSSQLAYGYGPSGNDSPESSRIPAIRLTNKIKSASNLVGHNLVGIDVFAPSKNSLEAFLIALANADIVHLHALHSHFWNFEDLIEQLIDSGKPIVWTMHDSWLLTGRCALPGDCRKWVDGCGTCPNMTAYPKALFDFSERQWIIKRGLLDRLLAKNRVILVSVSNWLAKDLRDAGFKNVRVIQNSSDQGFWDQAQNFAGMKRNGVLFVNRDLRDKDKVSPSTLNAVANAGIPLTVVGDFPPPSLDAKIQVIPSTRSRSKLAQIMSRHETLLFTSKVDNFPLTVVEALVCGMSVVLPDGKVWSEFSQYPQVRKYSSIEEILSILSDVSSGHNLDMSALKPDRMPSEYMKLYSELI